MTPSEPTLAFLIVAAILLRAEQRIGAPNPSMLALAGVGAAGRRMRGEVFSARFLPSSAGSMPDGLRPRTVFWWGESSRTR